MFPEPNPVVWSNIPVNITPSLPAALTSQLPAPSFKEVLDAADHDRRPTLLLPGLSGPRVNPIASTLQAPGLFTAPEGV